jgi:hypothetical protein
MGDIFPRGITCSGRGSDPHQLRFFVIALRTVTVLSLMNSKLTQTVFIPKGDPPWFGRWFRGPSFWDAFFCRPYRFGFPVLRPASSSEMLLQQYHGMRGDPLLRGTRGPAFNYFLSIPNGTLPFET